MNLSIQNSRVRLIDEGAGAPVLLLHGVPDNADMWAGVIARLAPRFRCIAPDLPGLGSSEAPAGFDCTLDSMAAWVDSLVTDLGIDQPLHVVVHDFGGPYGLAWAVRHPAQVRSLTISSTNFFSDYRWHSAARMWRTPVLGEIGLALVTKSVWRSQMRKFAPGLSDAYIDQGYTMSIANPAVRRMIMRLYRTTNPENFRGWEDELLQLTARVPTLVLWGDKDPFAPKSTAERYGGRVEHFAEYGHWLPVEAPEVYADRLQVLFRQ